MWTLRQWKPILREFKGNESKGTPVRFFVMAKRNDSERAELHKLTVRECYELFSDFEERLREFRQACDEKRRQRKASQKRRLRRKSLRGRKKSNVDKK